MRNFRFWLVLTLATAVHGEDAKKPISRQAPAIYQEQLAPRLTKFDAMKRELPKELGAEIGGVLQLTESIEYVQEDGKKITVDHRIIQPVNQAGVEAAARSISSYRPKGQKIHLVEARTITADGKSLPVKEDAAFLQSPQREADEALYNDYQELVVIFPDVKPGCQVESIIVIETEQPRIPGQYTSQEMFRGYWPIQKVRFQVDLPKIMSDRLQTSTVGTGVPEPTRKEEAGRVIMEWERTDVAPMKFEAGRQPPSQSGPCLFLSTIESWEAFLDWYAPQVMVKRELAAPLAKAVAETTAKATSPRDTLDKLLHKVSKEVRYVGLEFDHCDIIPHTPEEVWNNQYGDCKDKSNLLRYMLEAKGIKSYLALVNTHHMGRVEKRNPDYREFTHVILAVEEAPDKYIFCDPTVPGLRAGLLAPSSTKRDVLLVRDDGPARWLTTPAMTAGVLRYHIDASIDSSGAWSGWAKFGASDYYGAIYDMLEGQSGKDQHSRRMAGVLSGLSEAVRTIDVKKGTPNQPNDYAADIYFVIPGVGSSIKFPGGAGIFPALGDGLNRTTPFALNEETIIISGRLKLPPGWHPGTLPKAHQVTSPYADGTASWAFADGVLKAELEWKIKRTPLPAADAEAFAQSIKSFKAWLEHPIVMTEGEAASPPPASEDPLADFVRMPTADGQLALLYEKYHASNPTIRRAALRKARQYFPEDKTMTFNVGVQLAQLDIEAGKSDEALKELETLLINLKDFVEPEVFSSGEHIKALALADLKRTDEAKSIWSRISKDKTLTEQRRAFAHYRLGKSQSTKLPDEAMAHLREGLKLNSGAEHMLHQELAIIMIKQGKAEELTAELKQLISRKPERLSLILETLAETAGNNDAQFLDVSAGLLKVLRDLGEPQEISDYFAATLRKAGGLREESAIFKRVSETLIKFTEAHPKAIPQEEIPKALDSSAKLGQAAEELNTSAGSPAKAARYALERIRAYPPTEDFGHIVWRAAAFAEWWWRLEDNRSSDENPATPLVLALLDACEQLPPHLSAPYDAAVLRGNWLRHQKKFDPANVVFDKLLSNPDLPEAHRSSALLGKGQTLEGLQKFDEARKSYRSLEPLVTKYPTAMDGVYRGILIDLWDGNYDEALRCCGLFSKIKPEFMAEMDAGAGLQRLLAFTQDQKQALEYWAQSAKWWPKWNAIATKINDKYDSNQRIVPALGPHEQTGLSLQTATQARQTNEALNVTNLLAAEARWIPEAMVEFQGILALNQVWFKSVAKIQCYKLCMELAPFVPEPNHPLRRRSLVLAAAAAIDSHNGDRVSDYVEQFKKIPRATDPFSLGMAKIIVVASNPLIGKASVDKKLLRWALGELHSCLKNEVEDESPGITAALLLQAYDTLGADSIDKEVLTHLSGLQEIKLNPALLKRIDGYLKKAKDAAPPLPPLEKQTQPPLTGVAEACQNWLAKAKPLWWNLSQPKSIENDNETALKAMIAFDRENLQPSASKFFNDTLIRFKTAVLIMQNEKLSESLRNEALLVVLGSKLVFFHNSETRHAFIVHFADHPKLNPTVKNELFESVALTGALEAPKLWKDLKQLRITEAYTKESPELMNRFEDLLQDTPFNSSKLQQFAMECERVKLPMLAYAAYALLLDSGHTKIVKSMLRRMDAISKRRIELHLDREESSATAAAAWRKHLIEMLVDVESAKDPQQLNMSEAEMRLLPPSITGPIRLAQLRQTPQPITRLRTLTKIYSAKLSLDQKRRLLQSVVANLPPDISLHRICSSLLDTDQPDERQVIKELLQHRPAELARFEFHSELRTNPKCDIKKLCDSLSREKPGLDWTQLNHACETLLARGDETGVQSLATACPDWLKEARCDLRVSIERIGNRPSLESLRQQARQGLAAVLANVNVESGIHVLEMLDDLQMHDLITPAVDQALTGEVEATDPLPARLRLLQKRWQDALTLINNCIKEKPSVYQNYWYRAQAQSELGMDAEALEAVEIFLKYCHDDRDYPKALKLATKLREKK